MILAALSIMILDLQAPTIVKAILKESGSIKIILKESGSILEVKDVEKDQRGDTTHHKNSFTNFKTPTMTINNLKAAKKTSNGIIPTELHQNLIMLRSMFYAN